MGIRKAVVVVSCSSALALGVAGTAAALPRHGDNGSKQQHAHDMPGMTKAEMAAMDNASGGDDKGLSLLENGEMAHHYGPDQPLDAATRAQLVHQLALTTAVAAQYPTLGAARAAGYKQAGAFEPGLGTHMTGAGAGATNPDGTISDQAISRPPTIIYDGIADSAPIAGFMYTTLADKEPAGFAGPNDHWHYHDHLCVRMTPDGIKTVHAGAETTKAECAAAKAIWVPQNVWMVHVWTIPGYASNRGVFSDVNPAIACSDGTYYRVSQKDTLARYKVDHCRADAA